MKRLACFLLCLCTWLGAKAETIPPAPKQYFNDYAGVVSSSTASQLNSTLDDFERTASSQIVVAIYNKMDSDSSIEDYTVRVAQSWKVGQKDKNNGAVLFVFIQDRKLFIQVGYGLEAVLPDALCKDIVEDEIKPHFKSGDYDGGMIAGVNAIIAATKGEYKGTGHTVAEGNGQFFSDYDKKDNIRQAIDIAIVVLALILYISIRAKLMGGGGTIYHGNGRSIWYGGIGGGGFGRGGGGGGFSGGGFGGGGGGGGGFSGGGGSFGGGGAGGSW